jgi:hypothetical protein
MCSFTGVLTFVCVCVCVCVCVHGMKRGYLEGYQGCCTWEGSDCPAWNRNSEQLRHGPSRTYVSPSHMVVVTDYGPSVSRFEFSFVACLKQTQKICLETLALAPRPNVVISCNLSAREMSESPHE